MINPITLVRKPERILAVQVTADNIEEVAEWCGGEWRRTESGRRLKVPHDNWLASVGDFVIKDTKGWFAVVGLHARHRDYCTPAEAIAMIEEGME